MRAVAFIIGEFQASFVYVGRRRVAGGGRRGCVAFKVKSVGRRLAAPARRRLARAAIARPTRPVSLVTCARRMRAARPGSLMLALTGLEAPLLLLYVARRLQQIEEAHIGRRRSRARYRRARCHAATGHARRGRSRGRRRHRPISARRDSHVTAHAVQ